MLTSLITQLKSIMCASSHPIPIIAKRSPSLKGEASVPGDKSISHRALILGLLAIGETRIHGLLEGDDVLRTAQACRQLGATITRDDAGIWHVRGTGIGGLKEPEEVLDFGNAGTGSRLMMGVIAGHPIRATFDGDASLRKRPMRRILDPLEEMGALVLEQAEGGRVPLTVQGADETLPIQYETPAPSAQIKSAILLAGLNSPGHTIVLEREATRDHSERMLKHFGATIEVEPYQEHGRKITLHGQPELKGCTVHVPADPSSAAFPLVAALIVPHSHIVLNGLMLNPLRTGLLTTLQEMGADIRLDNQRMEGGETIADWHVHASALKGVDVPASRAPAMIDEYPILAVAASFASGVTRMRGLHELRVKESDRLAAIAAGLIANGVKAEIEGDDLIVYGGGITGGGVKGDGMVKTHLDHRIAMAFLVMGLASHEPVTIDDGAMIATSFPDFITLMQRLGAVINTEAA
jgi:3-phosphoshikimate 1-carboxyvinyltransferase